MIDLFSVKINGSYDEIGAMPSINNGTFLCSETVECNCNCGGFVKGYSYELVEGTHKRIEADNYRIISGVFNFYLFNNSKHLRMAQ